MSIAAGCGLTGGGGGGPPPGKKNSNLFQYRSPIDLNNNRLRKLAAALAPAYLRVSGTWANSTYFSDSDEVPSSPPAEILNGVLYSPKDGGT